MTQASDPERGDDEFWRDFLTRGDGRERQLRRVLRLIPQAPRCKLCAAPFSGPGAPLMRLIGKRPSARTPDMCDTCFDFMAHHHGGAEIECSFLFADIRGSTAIAEGMTATSFRGLLDRFYGTATKVVFDHDGSVDKFVGDELVAMFPPIMSGQRHASQAIGAARALLKATGHGKAGDPWVPLGAGVHTGPAWVGAVGDESHIELTALGDTVNTTARLASTAGVGEILVTIAAAEAAGLSVADERRSLDLKGKELPTDVVVLRV